MAPGVVGSSPIAHPINLLRIMLMKYGIVVHGGAGSEPDLSDVCKVACLKGIEIIESGGHALDVVTEAVKMLEDDGRFNAGRGSVLRLDGKTIEMDASVMDSRGKIGVVIAVKNTPNPVLVARAITNTPHIAIAGEGAERFAKKIGLREEFESSESAKASYERLKRYLTERKLSCINPLWKDHDIDKLWNFETPVESLITDTVGAVALDRYGIFAVASSTGGASPMLLGRVGDTPMVGCGFYAGELGAIAVTGIGEEIIKRMVALRIYELIENGYKVDEALKEMIESFPDDIPVGIIGITKDGYSVLSNTVISNYAIFK